MTAQTRNQPFFPALAVVLLIAAGLGLSYLTTGPRSTLEMEGQSKPQMSTAKPGATQEIEQIVRDYLLRNPQILREMAKRLEEVERVAKRERSKTLLKQYRSGIFASAGASPTSSSR